MGVENAPGQTQDPAAALGGPAAGAPAEGTATQQITPVGTPARADGGEGAKPEPKETFAWAQMRHRTREVEGRLETQNRELEQLRTQYAQAQQSLQAYGLLDPAIAQGQPAQASVQAQGVTHNDVMRIATEITTKRELASAQDEALKWMAYQEDVSSQGAMKELMEVMKRYGQDRLFYGDGLRGDPYAAAEVTVEMWRRERAGKGPSGTAGVDKLMASGVPGGPARTGAPSASRLTPEQIRAMPMDEFRKRADELWAASGGSQK